MLLLMVVFDTSPKYRRIFFVFEYSANWSSIRNVSHFPEALLRVNVTDHRYPDCILQAFNMTLNEEGVSYMK